VPRVATKLDLVTSANDSFEEMWGMVDSMPLQQQTGVFNFDGVLLGKEAHWTRDTNIRDVFVHLYEWHQLLLSWVASNIGGDEKPFLPHPYNWRTYGVMNVGFWEKHQNTSYDTSRELLQDSHKKVMFIIEKFTDTELFEKKHFKWTGTSSLGQYCISATISHYDWAMKKIKLHIKTYKEL
jgi:hypothetical protein